MPVWVAAALEERAAAGEQRLPCLVVCPQTLVLHWAHEVHKFAADAIRTVAYHGSPTVSAPVARPLPPTHTSPLNSVIPKRKPGGFCRLFRPLIALKAGGEASLPPWRFVPSSDHKNFHFS